MNDRQMDKKSGKKLRLKKKKVVGFCVGIGPGCFAVKMQPFCACSLYECEILVCCAQSLVDRHDREQGFDEEKKKSQLAPWVFGRLLAAWGGGFGRLQMVTGTGRNEGPRVGLCGLLCT